MIDRSINYSLLIKICISAHGNKYLTDLQIFDSTHHLNCVYVILCASDILFRVIESIAMNVLRTRVLAIDMCVRKVLIHIRPYV